MLLAFKRLVKDIGAINTISSGIATIIPSLRIFLPLFRSLHVSAYLSCSGARFQARTSAITSSEPKIRATGSSSLISAPSLVTRASEGFKPSSLKTKTYIYLNDKYIEITFSSKND